MGHNVVHCCLTGEHAGLVTTGLHRGESSGDTSGGGNQEVP
jgi:hypothetical protein